ncbi:MAG TPA: LiaF domain-containing protein [Myxococcota bacterium]|nr:LiaF domain-containing protein [Myxococcota bacterium]
MSEPVRERDYEHVPEVGTVTAVFSATARRGEWLPPEELRVRALFGAVQLDFRKALLAPGETTLEVLALFGAVEILVPHDLEVEVAASAVLGSVEQRDHGGGMKGFIAEQIRRATGQVHERRELRPADEEPPLLRVEGRAVFGSIIVRRR